MLDLSKLNPAPLRFGQCGKCAYLETGSAELCYTCASRDLQRPGPLTCHVCSQTLPAKGQCANYLCTRPYRSFDRVHVVAMNSGPLLRAIRAYKDEDARGWAWLFGRVLAGYLDANSTLFEGFDLIALNPSYTGDGAARTWDHVRLIAERADVESLGRWPFDLSRRAVIEKTSMTPRMREAATAQERRRIGFEELAPALLVTAPTRVHGKRILVFDDVFTAGDTLQQVAFKLRGAGAASVSALVLARQPWTRP